MNYQRILDQTIGEITKNNVVPTLLLHSCCAPCSSYVIEYLSNFFEITVYYYNPNIFPDVEYLRRADEQRRYIEKLSSVHPIKFLEGEFDPTQFDAAIAGNEQALEGGKRCYSCYHLRLNQTALVAKSLDYNYFCTTLSVSPHKNAAWINEIGEELSKKFAVNFLRADFKKKEGYKRSLELSKIHNLYRQDYCGCRFSVHD